MIIINNEDNSILQMYFINQQPRKVESIRTNIKKFQKPLNYFSFPIPTNDDTELLLSRNIGCFIYLNAKESTIFNFLVNLILDDRIYAFNEIILNLWINASENTRMYHFTFCQLPMEMTFKDRSYFAKYSSSSR